MVEATLPVDRPNALLTWLRYDPNRVQMVEDAYDEFIARSRYGVAISLALAASMVAAIIVVAGNPGAPKAQLTGTLLVVITCTFYLGQLLALLAVPREVLATMLAGAIDLRRGLIFGFVSGGAIAIFELGIAAVLLALHVPSERTTELFSGSVLFGLFMILIAAPIAEEFMMQGWLQTRLRRYGPAKAGTLTTFAFVLMHVPTSSMAFVRTVVLGGVAVTRATTRSLGSAIAMHFANNLFFAILVLVSMARAALPHK